MSETALELARRIGFEGGRFIDPAGARVVVAILTCAKNRDRADAVRSTWYRRLPTTYRLLFVQARPGVAPGIEGDTLFVDCVEAYENLPEKTHRLLAYATGNLEFDGLFKTDDDTYLDLERFIGFDKAQGDYIGQFREAPLAEIGKTWHYGKCSDKSLEVPYERPFVCPWATGGGYLLSRKATAIAAEKTAGTYAEHLFEDTMVGEALTPEPRIRAVRSRLPEMGVINPLLPKDMRYIDEVMLERRQLADQVLALRRNPGPGSPAP